MILDIRTRVCREKVFELARRSQRPDVQSSIFISVRAGSWLCVERRDPRVRAETPMKIIISVKWTSLGQEETASVAQTKSGYIESAGQLRTVCESRLSEDADPLTGQLDFIA